MMERPVSVMEMVDFIIDCHIFTLEIVYSKMDCAPFHYTQPFVILIKKSK